MIKSFLTGSVYTLTLGYIFINLWWWIAFGSTLYLLPLHIIHWVIIPVLGCGTYLTWKDKEVTITQATTLTAVVGCYSLLLVV